VEGGEEEEDAGVGQEQSAVRIRWRGARVK
jgi:hypothetical protein